MAETANELGAIELAKLIIKDPLVHWSTATVEEYTLLARAVIEAREEIVAHLADPAWEERDALKARVEKMEAVVAAARLVARLAVLPYETDTATDNDEADRRQDALRAALAALEEPRSGASHDQPA